jgi:hypothetical protein
MTEPAPTRVLTPGRRQAARTFGFLEVLGERRVSKIVSLAHYKEKRANVWWQYLAYKQALRLHELGFEYNCISMRIRRSNPYLPDYATVADWISNRRDSSDWKISKLEIAHLVYLLAAGIGDGCAKYGGRNPFLHFQHLKDKDFAEVIASYSGSIVTTNKSRGYDVVLSNPVLADLVNAGKSEPKLIYPLLCLHPRAALRGFFDAEGGADPTHGVPRAFNTNQRIIEAFSDLLGELSIHHTTTITKMRPLMVVRGRTYLRRKLIKYGISVSSCCMGRYDKLVSFSIRRKAAILSQKVGEREAKRLKSCPTGG